MNTTVHAALVFEVGGNLVPVAFRVFAGVFAPFIVGGPERCGTGFSGDSGPDFDVAVGKELLNGVGF